MMAVFEAYAPLWETLTPEAREKALKVNYERLFAKGAAKHSAENGPSLISAKNHRLKQ